MKFPEADDRRTALPEQARDVAAGEAAADHAEHPRLALRAWSDSRRRRSELTNLMSRRSQLPISTKSVDKLRRKTCIGDASARRGGGRGTRRVRGRRVDQGRCFHEDAKLSLVAYSTPREAYGELIPAFQKTPAGDGVSFSQSYGRLGRPDPRRRGRPEGRHRRALARARRGRARQGRARRLEAGSGSRTRGMVTNSVVVFVVRDGNPKNIKAWDDLLKPGVQVITPNPFTSGGARWNVMAAYGAQRKLGKTDEQAQAYLRKLFKNVAVAGQERARRAADVHRGKGDVLLTYENEAISAQSRGQKPRLRDPALDDPDREPDRRPQDERPQGRGERVPPLPADAGGAADLRRQRLPAGRQDRRARSSRRSSRRARACSRSTSSVSAAGPRCRRTSSIRGRASWPRIERQVGGVTG